MKKIYEYDENAIQFKLHRPNYKLHALIYLSILIFGYVLGNYYSLVDKVTFVFGYQNKTLPIGSDVWKDSVFTEYEIHANLYISEKYPDSPIKGGMLSLAAHNVYDSTGILVPVEFALAQAQIESSMGTKGKSPINNPYNVGEYDSGTVKWFNNTYDGIEAYYFLISRRYMKCKSIHMLFKSFTDCAGRRYASSLGYEVEIEKQYQYIRKFIDKELTQMSENQKLLTK